MQQEAHGIKNNNCNTYTDINRLAELSALECVLILSSTPKSTTQHSCHLDIWLLGIMCNSENKWSYEIWDLRFSQGCCWSHLVSYTVLTGKESPTFQTSIIPLVSGSSSRNALWNISNYALSEGTQWCSWLRHCATSQKVAGSIRDGVTGIFHWHNPSGCTMALGSTQPLMEMSTRNTSWGVKAAGA